MALTVVLLLLSLSSLLLAVVADQLEDIFPSTTIRFLVLLGALTATCLAILGLIVQLVWRIWLRWTVKVSDSPSSEGALADVIAVRLDPAKGIVMDVLSGSSVIPVLVNPEYWNLLPSAALSRRDGLEAAVLGSVVTNVKTGSEPASLVAISNGSEIVGMGSRVTYLGRSYLLTANHVWNGNFEKRYLAKGDLQAEVPSSATISYGCLDPRVDFALVAIPENIWSRLQVKSSPLSIMAKQSLVTIYGGKDTKHLLCSSGRANKGEYSHDIVHGCTSTNGWSGTPLYHKGAVVGIHCGSKKLGFENRGVNVGVLLSGGLETVYSEITNTLIDEEEAADRDYPFIEVDIIGRGQMGIGRGEYFLPRDSFAQYGGQTKWEDQVRSSGRLLWSDVDDSDIFYDTLETVSGHLNCQRAEVPRHSPPSFLLETTTGSEATSSPRKECHCTELASRVCNLEKLVEKLLVLRSSPPLVSSPNSQNSTGPSEAPKPSSDPSCSKQVGSKRRRSRKTSQQPAKGSQVSTPSRESEDASEGKTGTTATSRRRLRRSAKATSTSKPPPVSHSVSLGKQTVRS